jgi:FlaA1/EpsC-like NDP-sugar epimerase
MNNKKILIIGGSGSLGTELILKYYQDNIILNISRNENKQWKLRNIINSSNLSQIIGDIYDYDEIKYHIYNFNPTIIIFAAALKHIDICEKQIDKCFKTNFLSLFNMINDIKINKNKYSNLETFVFVSTDKACLPITVYGYSKASSEKLIQTTQIDNIKFITIRYGNVINSSGSIIPLLHSIGKDQSKTSFTLTDKNMTRFIITLEDSVNLIDYAIKNAKNNEIIVPFLKSCRIIDLIELFSRKYNKPIVICGLRCIEKYSEDLISTYEELYTYKLNDKYIHISSERQLMIENQLPFSSSNSIISIDELKEYLEKYIYIS